MLASPLGAVVAVRDTDEASPFFARLGMAETGRGSLPPGLYGTAGRYVDLAAAERGRVRLVEVAGEPAPRQPLDAGLAALDFYSRDLARSLAQLDAAHDAPVRIDLGPLVMHQVRLTGPDTLPVVLIDASSRRPSLLDTDDEALHSEAHSMVWVVPDIAEAAGFWTSAGLALAFDIPVSSPAVAEVMRLPRPDVPVRMAMLSDDAVRPMRLELFAFPDDGGAPADPALRPGTAWPAFEVTSLEDALALPWVDRGPVVDVAGRRTARCVAPGGVVAELWS